MTAHEQQVKKIIDEAEGSITVSYVAQKVGIGWATARFLLLKLAAEGLVKAEALEPRGWVFRSTKR